MTHLQEVQGQIEALSLESEAEEVMAIGEMLWKLEREVNMPLPEEVEPVVETEPTGPPVALNHAAGCQSACWLPEAGY